MLWHLDVVDDLRDERQILTYEKSFRVGGARPSEGVLASCAATDTRHELAQVLSTQSKVPIVDHLWEPNSHLCSTHIVILPSEQH